MRFLDGVGTNFYVLNAGETKHLEELYIIYSLGWDWKKWNWNMWKP